MELLLWNWKEKDSTVQYLLFKPAKVLGGIEI